MKRIILAAMAAVPFATVQAATLDVNINNESIRAEYDAPLPQNRMHMAVGVLYHEENNADAVVAHAGLHTQEDTPDYSVGIGGRGYWVSASGGLDGLAMALGVQGSVQLPQVRIGGHLYYAPQVISFGDLDGLTDLSVRAYYQALKDVDVYLGWRKLELDVDGHSGDLDASLNVGFVMNF